jgi:hypothetical protein
MLNIAKSMFSENVLFPCPKAGNHTSPTPISNPKLEPSPTLVSTPTLNPNIIPQIKFFQQKI